MARLPLAIREAVVVDADALLRMWAASGTGMFSLSDQSEAEAAIERISASALERLVVGEVEGRVVAVVHLRRAPMSPLHMQEVVHTSFLLVEQDHRRHGYARALLEVGVTWAEELGIDYVTALTTAASRDSNRFLARLGLASTATLRMAPAALLRAKLNPAPRLGVAARGQVLAQRRTMRRRQAVR
ncbi:MAG: GNAT family N-acetyltransferase [Marmoricola sp.]